MSGKWPEFGDQASLDYLAGSTWRAGTVTNREDIGQQVYIDIEFADGSETSITLPEDLSAIRPTGGAVIAMTNSYSEGDSAELEAACAEPEEAEDAAMVVVVEPAAGGAMPTPTAVATRVSTGESAVAAAAHDRTAEAADVEPAPPAAAATAPVVAHQMPVLAGFADPRAAAAAAQVHAQQAHVQAAQVAHAQQAQTQAQYAQYYAQHAAVQQQQQVVAAVPRQPTPEEQASFAAQQQTLAVQYQQYYAQQQAYWVAQPQDQNAQAQSQQAAYYQQYYAQQAQAYAAQVAQHQQVMAGGQHHMAMVMTPQGMVPAGGAYGMQAGMYAAQAQAEAQAQAQAQAHAQPQVAVGVASAVQPQQQQSQQPDGAAADALYAASYAQETHLQHSPAQDNPDEMYTDPAAMQVAALGPQSPESTATALAQAQAMADQQAAFHAISVGQQDPATSLWVCPTCSKQYRMQSALTKHLKKGCLTAVWKCNWCECGLNDSRGRAPGPDGASTLCSKCGALFRHGYLSKPKVNEKGLYECPMCSDTFQSLRGLSGHRRYCPGKLWECDWCNDRKSKIKGIGPNGPGSLCGTCAGRYKCGFIGLPVANPVTGKFNCESCENPFESIRGLSSHQRICSGGKWRCEWCNVKEVGARGKGPGPSGPAALCSVCASRFRAGHLEPPQRDPADNKFVCPGCAMKFETMRGLGSHTRGCSGGTWRCEWCNADEKTARGKSPGPNGPKTLCSRCGSRYRSGQGARVPRNAEGLYVCDRCTQTFDSLVRMSGHKRFCDGGTWRCNWCSSTTQSAAGKGPGPDGARTLCSACSSRYRSGHTGPPPKDADGRLFCPDCEKRFDTISGLGSHRRFCTREIKAGNKAELIEDLILGGGLVDAPTTPATDLPVKIVGDVLQIWSSMQFLIRCVKSEIERKQAKTKDKPSKDKLDQQLAGVDAVTATWEEMEVLFKAESPEAIMMSKFHQIHCFLVTLLFHDMCNEGDEDEEVLLMGRSINHYTWPELLRQYLNLSAAEVNVNSDKPPDAAFEFGKMANWLATRELDTFTIRDRIDMLLLLTHRSCETPLIRRYVEQVTTDLSKAKMASKAKYTRARKQIHEQTKEEAELKAKSRAEAKAVAAAAVAANLAEQQAFAAAAQKATAARVSTVTGDAAWAAMPPLVQDAHPVGASAGFSYAAGPGEAADIAVAPMNIEGDANTLMPNNFIPQTDGATDDVPYDVMAAEAAVAVMEAEAVEAQAEAAAAAAEAVAATAAAVSYTDTTMSMANMSSGGYYGVQAAAANDTMYYGAHAPMPQEQTFVMQQGGGEAMSISPTASMLYSGQVLNQPAALAQSANAAPPAQKKRGSKRKNEGAPGTSGSPPPKKLGRPPKDKSGDKRAPFDPKKMKTRRKAEAQAREEIAFELQGIVDAMCYRLTPLGFDRNYNSYWIIGARYNLIWIQTLSGPRETWSVIKTIEEVDLLINSLDQRGIRESVLRRGLMDRKKRFADEMPKPRNPEETPTADSLPLVKQEPGAAPMLTEDTAAANGGTAATTAAPIAHLSAEMLAFDVNGNGATGEIKQEESAVLSDGVASDTVSSTHASSAGVSAIADTAAMEAEPAVSDAAPAEPPSSEITVNVASSEISVDVALAPERQSRSKSKKAADTAVAVVPEKDYSAIYKSRACRFIEQEQGPAITRCGYCQEALSPAHERHCPLCHETFGALHKSSTVSGFDKHIRACEKKLSSGDPTRNEEDATLPFWVLAIKGELQDIDAAITPKSIKGWTKPQRNSWGALVKQASTVAQCEDLLIDFIAHVDPKYLSHEWRPWREVKIAIAGGDWRKDWDVGGVYNASLGVYVDPFAPLVAEPLVGALLEAAPFVDPNCHPCNTGSHQAHTCSKGLGRSSVSFRQQIRPAQRAPARASVDLVAIEPIAPDAAPTVLPGAVDAGAGAEESPQIAEQNVVPMLEPASESESEATPAVKQEPEAVPEAAPAVKPEPEPEPELNTEADTEAELEPVPEPEPEPESDDEPDTPPPATPPPPGMEMDSADRDAATAAAELAAAKAAATKAARAARAAAENDLERLKKPVSTVARKPPGRVPAGKEWDYDLGMWVIKKDDPSGDAAFDGAFQPAIVGVPAEAGLAVAPVVMNEPTAPVAATSTVAVDASAIPAPALATEATPAAAEAGAPVPMETEAESAPVTDGSGVAANVDAGPVMGAAGMASTVITLDKVNYSSSGALYGAAALAESSTEASSAAMLLKAINYSPTGALYGAAAIAAKRSHASASYEEEEAEEEEEEETVMFPCENEAYAPVPRGSRRTKRWKKKEVRTAVRCIFWLSMFDQAATYGLKAKPPRPPKPLKRKFMVPLNEEFDNSNWLRPPKKSRSNRDSDGVEKRSHHKKVVPPGTA